MGIVERNGELRAGVIEDTTADTLTPIVEHHVAKGSIVVTDNYRSYRGLNKDFRHFTVRHSRRQYVRGRCPHELD
jgi:transposase-like protein